MCKRTFQRGMAWRKGTFLTVDGTIAYVWYFEGLKEKKEDSQLILAPLPLCLCHDVN